MPLVEPVVKIENAVATAALKHRINLKDVVRALPEVEYRPEQFPGLIYRMNDPRVVILLFASGKLVCTGARKEEDVHQAVNSLHQKLEKSNLIRHE
ncbi:MAG: hypothetical protein ACE5OW_04155 [Candidatus Bathyarchaeia archaeon]